MPPVDGRAIKARAARLRAAGAARVAAHLAEQQGQRHAVLMESPRLGRTEQFTETLFAEDRPEGAIITATVTGHTGTQLLAV
jgi:threonylcarbamoyladenosine tRNA methylthiotransferase MtaB